MPSTSTDMQWQSMAGLCTCLGTLQQGAASSAASQCEIHDGLGIWAMLRPHLILKLCIHRLSNNTNGPYTIDIAVTIRISIMMYNY